MTVRAESILPRVLGVLLYLLAANFTYAQTVPAHALNGHVPAAARNLPAVGTLATTHRLDLSIGLPLRDPAGLTNLLRDLYNPASPNFRHFLTPAEFARRFGPTKEDYQAVVRFAETNGLKVTRTHGNGLLLDVNGNVADIERALHVTMHVYQHPTQARTFFAPDTNPSLPVGLPVLHINGLDNFAPPRPMSLHPEGGTGGSGPKPNLGSGPNGNYLGNDFRSAYLPGVTWTGAGQTIDLVEFDGYYSNDIVSYEDLAGLTNVPLQNVYLNGYNGFAGNNDNEVSLDIEMAIAMAPGLSQVIVYEGITPNDVLNQMAMDNNARQLSCSWTWGVGSDPETDQIFQEFAAQGQSFFQAVGDNGAYVGAVDAPADDPYVTVVGGTTLSTTGPEGSWLGDTVWNWLTEGKGNFVDGGGVSTFYGMPDWQMGVDMSTNGGSATARNIPDVAMVADNIWVTYGNGASEPLGGTSAAAPLWAGMAALMNQEAAAAGAPPPGFLNPAIYQLAAGTNYARCFHDVTTGANTNQNSPNQFYAMPGFDLCTGWGTPASTALIDALAIPDSLAVSPPVGFTSGGPIGGPFNVTSLNCTLTNISASPVHWSAGSSAAWLDLNPTNGILAPAGPAATVTATLDPSAVNLGLGIYTASARFTNLDTGIVQSRQFTLRVGQALVVNGGFETGDFSGWTLVGDPSENIVEDIVNDPQFVHSGKFGAHLGQVDEPIGTLSQTVATIPGAYYLLSFWLGSGQPATPTGTPNEFAVAWNGNTLMDETNIGVIGWTNVAFVVSAVTNNTVLEFGFRDDPWGLGLDDVSVKPVPVPAFQKLGSSNGMLQLNWNTASGLVYQVQYSTDLGHPFWSNLFGPVMATGSSLGTTDSIGPDPRRFYRLQVVP